MYEQRTNNRQTTNEQRMNNGQPTDEQWMNNRPTLVKQWTNNGRTEKVTYMALLCPSGYTNYVYGGEIKTY